MSGVTGQSQAQWWQADRITLMGFIAVLCGVLILSVLSFSSVESLERNILRLTERYNRKNAIIHSVSHVINHRMMMVRDILLVDDPFLRDEMVQKFSRLGLEYNRYFSQLKTFEPGPEEQDLLNQMSEQVAEATSLRESILGIPTSVDEIETKQLLNSSLVMSSKFHSLLNDLQAQQRKDFEADIEYTRHIHARNQSILFITFLLVFMGMLFIAYRVSGFVRSSNRRLTTMAMEKSMLLATMSHEIRTPLTSIIGFGETLLETDTTKEERIAGINAIVRNGRYLQGVINDVLDFSKLDAGQMDLQLESVSLSSCLDDMDNMLRGRAQSKGLGFNIIAKGELPEYIKTDSIKLRQILINLLGNAIKYTESGSVRMEVSFDENAGRINFNVIDTGMGIDREQLQRLFTPYRQLGQSHQEGTGLGLYISKEMAELLGGELSVNSEPGRGSQFSFSLPSGEVGEQRRIQWQRRASEKTQANTYRGVQFSGKVLLAEDGKDNQKLFSIYLNKVGLEVDIVEDGEQAIRAALADDYVLVLMDMQMPVMDGVAATAELRQCGYRVPIIALTANQSAEERQRCKQAGFDDFLSKPISRADFIQVLSDYLLVESRGEGDSDSPIFSLILQQEPELQPAVDYFVGQLPEIQRHLDEIILGEDWSALKELIHDLKGTAGGVGYPMLSQLAMEVEFALAKQDYEEVGYLIVRVSNRIHRIQKGYTLQQGENVPPSSGGH